MIQDDSLIAFLFLGKHILTQYKKNTEVSQLNLSHLKLQRQILMAVALLRSVKRGSRIKNKDDIDASFWKLSNQSH